MHPMLNIATRAARSAGELILRSTDNIGALKVPQKSKNGFASEIDKSAEREIIRIINSAYPDHSIIAEESGHHPGNDYVWIIDPLDGTTNFLHGFPQYSISIALTHKGKITQGVIFDPLKDELFCASRGAGALLNDRKIRVSQQTHLQGSLLGTGFPVKPLQYLDVYLEMFKALHTNSAGIRRTGSAALDLAYLAAGRLDGFWEIGLRPWNMAAGVLLIQEAGGIVTDFSFDDHFMKSGNIIAGNPKMHQIIYNTINPHITDALK
ncbi:MAG TPA: inositol monophosphatase [Methylococcaceae bacterium]|nr:inositol monophosphatase [Methylococcaceae bacterium]HIA46325.1 inositol monophosphatase [Methylococcaceae bacterium]HIB61842.1 inositol monophosphatase [Methylococcaceae bacterium]HIN68336.1 inositol monophosphatase [Methylococcales bacterium]HIO44715.1 inositol monophosphatase [Methylococcales bacterium]